MVRPKYLMRDFINLNRTYKAHRTNVWWIMKVFQVHSILIIQLIFQGINKLISLFFSLQAMALAELKHPYICGYKEFFVTWDKEVGQQNGFHLLLIFILLFVFFFSLEKYKFKWRFSCKQIPFILFLWLKTPYFRFLSCIKNYVMQ